MKSRIPGIRIFTSPLLAVTVLTLLLTMAARGALAKSPSAIIGKGNVVKLEVAQTEVEITRGLMYRTSMPEDAGMIFLFDPPRPVNFWMYHTLIPLDMLFIKDGKIVKVFTDVPPCKSLDPHGCATYPAGDGIDVTEVIEVNGGYAQRHGIKEGDPVTFTLNASHSKASAGAQAKP